MAGQQVFKGALGWDDWIWWSGIGGLGLLLLMLVLCCVVCVQRAKRKGREEALAAVQARERERQTQEQAQLRYAQAQQARYPAREASYKFSKPEPPAPSYNPYGHDDHGLHRNSYLANAPAPKPKARRGSQQPPGQQPMQQEYAYPPQHQQQQDQHHQQQYYAAPGRDAQPPYQQQQQQQQQYGCSQPNEHAPYEQQPTRPEPEELPQVAAYYGRKTQPQAEPPRASGPMMSQQYQRQHQVNPNQPMIAQYRKFSGRSDATPGSSFVQEEPPAAHETPFVQVATPRGSAASTASTAYSAAAPPHAQPSGPTGFSDRASVTSSTSSSMRPGTTLRDRIDALRDGPAPAPHGENFARVSVGSAASLTGSQSSQHQLPQQSLPPPPQQQQQQQQQQPAHRVAAAPAPRRLNAISNTMLSDASSTENEFLDTRYNNAFDEEAFATARSNQRLRRAGSDSSIGVDDDLESPAVQRDDQRRIAARQRTATGDSSGSIEF